MDFILIKKYDDFIAFNLLLDFFIKWYLFIVNYVINLNWKLFKWFIFFNKVWFFLDIYILFVCMYICIFDLKIFWNFELIF